MSNMIAAIVDGYNSFVESGDKRISEWMFVKSPLPTVAMTATYLLFVKVLGPKWMQNRPAFDLRNVMIIYNFTMVIVSFLMFIEMANLIQWGRYTFQCQKVDYSTDDVPMRMCKVGWLFLVTKYIEFVDTVFFVLRKKQSHVSKLHVIHHSAVPASVWIGLKFAPGGNNAIFPVLNSGVHTVMYLYYGLAAFGPSLRKYLWWKKYLTSLQLIQFALVMIHGFINYARNCDFPRIFIVLNVFDAVLFFFLFSSFYRDEYKKPVTVTKSVAAEVKSSQKTFVESTYTKISNFMVTACSDYWAKCGYILPLLKSCFQWDTENFYYSKNVQNRRHVDEYHQKLNGSNVAILELNEEHSRKLD